MSTKSRYIEPHHASRVAAALRQAGYAASPADCTGFVINVARRINPHDETAVRAVIDTALDGYAVDAEGYAYDALHPR